MNQPTIGRLIRSALLLAALMVSLIAATAGPASAEPWVTCVGNSDSRTGEDKGICIVLPLP